MDFDESQPDSAFIEEMKDALAYFIGEWFEELQDGFHNGMQDVMIFFRDNFKALLIAAAPPDMGMMISMMGTDVVMKYIIAGNNRYRERKSVIVAASKARTEKKKSGLSSQTAPIVGATAATQQDAEMNEEEKDETPEDRKKRFWDRWQSVIEEDEEDLPEGDQRPLSRAYLSLCPSNRSTNKQVQDEKTAS